MTEQERNDLLESAYDALEERIWAINEDIFAHPELSFEEHHAAELLADTAESLGFAVERRYAGFDTAFRAVYGSGKPVVAFLAEYDALPGYGPERKPAHACGHSWIAATSFGAAAVTMELLKQMPGTVMLYGTPAEETTGPKVNLVRQGCFDGVDAVFQMHLSGNKTALRPQALALDPIGVTFKGKAAHAASAPQNGINALDACNLTFCGVNALRQHVTPDVRMHGIITEGGTAPNIVPALCSMRWYLRAADRGYLNGLREKFINCLRGAALMTGAEMEWQLFENSFDDIVNDDHLLALMEKNLVDLGEVDLDRSIPAPFGSSDIGNVSHVVPTVYVSYWAGNDDGADIHDERFLQHVTSDATHQRIRTAVLAMARSAADVLEGK